MSRKNPAAVSLGRTGGKATAKKLTPAQRSASARRAACARWAKDPQMKQALRAAREEGITYPAKGETK
jgi:hypothetical protein